ncbi:MAG: hypothetical protein A2452_11025 [Candidatus Firestonebacteria bacterium RIFOXYC2_FULL_39_67]|nr:MAG: hypothetical protein A2452_11025 [Candidatus Firestonebacteria bacterium RIFOXYC2_FULL_39_67]
MRMCNKILIVLVILMVQGLLWAEGLFESTTSDQSKTTEQAIDKTNVGLSLSGFIKSGVFFGQDEQFRATTLREYGEFDLKGDVVKDKLGRALIDIRYFSDVNSLDVREAWVETSTGSLDIRLGRQIIVWGRADSINPTNNITPFNSLVLSSEYDDTRLSNELVQLKLKLAPELNLQAIWVPAYRSDTLVFDRMSLPAGISIGQNAFPVSSLSNGSVALRMEAATGAIDGSISYYYGYNVLPGFDYTFTMTGMAIVPTAYRMQAIGGDFSTALAGFGLRGEVCAKIPELSQSDYVYIPAPYLQYVFGVDRSMGDFNVLVQYSGLYVTDFKQLDPLTMNPAALQMATINRLFLGTSDQVSHAATAQIGWNGMSDTLHVKLAGMYIFTTKEYAVLPSITYDIADALTGTIGVRNVDGPDSSLNHMINKLMSMAYVELKCSF